MKGQPRRDLRERNESVTQAPDKYTHFGAASVK